MTLEEQKLAVCEKLPELIWIGKELQWWLHENKKDLSHIVNWPTEGLQVCHEAEKLLTLIEAGIYLIKLREVADNQSNSPICATYSQRLLALCRVWYPERFK